MLPESTTDYIEKYFFISNKNQFNELNYFYSEIAPPAGHSCIFYFLITQMSTTFFFEKCQFGNVKLNLEVQEPNSIKLATNDRKVKINLESIRNLTPRVLPKVATLPVGSHGPDRTFDSDFSKICCTRKMMIWWDTKNRKFIFNQNWFGVYFKIAAHDTLQGTVKVLGKSANFGQIFAKFLKHSQIFTRIQKKYNILY